MWRTWAAVVVAVAAMAQAGPRGQESKPVARETKAVAAVFDALHAVEGRPLWPGFELARVPVAVFDGQRTYLLRHPAPPSEFAPVPGSALRAVDGQHSTMRANTSVELAGVLTATYMATGGASPEASAAIIAHEAFHVFQRQKHPDWVTNEVNLFTYPFEDVKNLAQARLEAAAFERALSSPDAAQAACWSRAALAVRTERFSRLPQDAVSYERGVELVEGTASLVQYRAGERSQPSISASGLAADGTRRRAYAAGRTIGLLLDRLAPGWEARLEAAKPQAVLDEELARALPSPAGAPCASGAEEVEFHDQAAARDVAVFVARRNTSLREFTDAAGWRVIIRAAEGAPLKPQGFDPMNVLRLDAGQVLHTRWVKAGTGEGAVEVMNRSSLTRAAGSHPLFSGFRELEVTGLPAEPEVTAQNGGIMLIADGVQARFAHATLARGNRTITITVSKP